MKKINILKITALLLAGIMLMAGLCSCGVAEAQTAGDPDDTDAGTTTVSTSEVQNEDTSTEETSASSTEETTAIMTTTTTTKQSKATTTTSSTGSTKHEELPELSEEVEIQVKQTYLDYLHTLNGYPEATLEDVLIRKYYGTYNGAVVVMMSTHFGDYATVVCIETIDGVEIGYPDMCYITIWKDGAFYRLQTAYDQGFLKRDDLLKIVDINSSRG